jgi:hypothetical protein
MSALGGVIVAGTGTISVRNNGKGVPVAVHKEHDIYVPELIFGHLLTSSNYDDDEKKVTGAFAKRARSETSVRALFPRILTRARATPPPTRTRRRSQWLRREACQHFFDAVHRRRCRRDEWTVVFADLGVQHVDDGRPCKNRPV